MTDFRHFALCADPRVDPEVFFPVDERPGSPGVERAKRVCNACPVLDECRAWAVGEPLDFGVFGGLSADERRRLRSRAGRRVAAR
jgi:WhiB family redox-sensing transcriptional regulator